MPLAAVRAGTFDWIANYAHRFHVVEGRVEQELLLEIDEDHATVSRERADNTQIKFSDAANGARAVSLRSPGVVEAIERYWHQSRHGSDPIFMTSLYVDPEFHIENLCEQLQAVPVDMTGVQDARCAVSRVGARRIRLDGGVCPHLRPVVRWSCRIRSSHSGSPWHWPRI